MKKIGIIVFFALSVLLCLTLCGCYFGYFGEVYANADKYSSGDGSVSGEVEFIDISWTSGKVDVVYHAGNDIKFSEQTNASLTDEFKLHYFLDGKTLYIKFAASGVVNNRIYEEKTLTLSLPEKLRVNNFEISTASADVCFENAAADNVKINTASGEVEFGVRDDSDSVKISTASGDVAFSSAGAINELQISTASGRVRGTLADVGEMDINTASGSIFINMGYIGSCEIDTASGSAEVSAAGIGHADFDTASGHIMLAVNEMPEKCRLNSASGRIEVYLPENSDFTARVETVSGRFTSDFPFTMNGHNYVCGSGASDLKLETVSGNIYIKRTEK